MLLTCVCVLSGLSSMPLSLLYGVLWYVQGVTSRHREQNEHQQSGYDFRSNPVGSPGKQHRHCVGDGGDDGGITVFPAGCRHRLHPVITAEGSQPVIHRHHAVTAMCGCPEFSFAFLIGFLRRHVMSYLWNRPAIAYPDNCVNCVCTTFGMEDCFTTA